MYICVNVDVVDFACSAEDVVWSFTRGCEVLDDVEEGCVEDTHFNTCWTKCSTDMCNDGDGWPEDTDSPQQGKG